MKDKNFERELPNGYKQVLHVDAKSARFGIIFNLIALLVLALTVLIGAIPVDFGGKSFFDVLVDEYFENMLSMLVTLIAIIAYVVLHELAHGIAYKSLTKEKLTFGVSWSCFFCGVPSIYTYRKTALISASVPFIVFTVVLIPITIMLYFVNVIFYFEALFLLGLHIGGCSGDLYLIGLLLFKYRNRKTLVRDTGPEQFICVPDENAEQGVTI